MERHGSTVAAIVLIGVCVLIMGSCAIDGGQSIGEKPTWTDLEARPVDLQPLDPSDLDFSVPPEDGAKPVISPYKAKTLILMYHNISTLSRAEAGDYDRNITDFENDLIYLKNNGYTVIGLDDILKIQSGALAYPESARLAVIVVDDGFSSAYTRAFPLLKKYGMKATFFLPTSFIGTPGHLSWSQVRLMRAYRNASGTQLLNFGSHTVDHRSLAYSAYPAETFSSRTAYLLFLNMELGQSRRTIQTMISQSPIFLALPYGQGAYDTDIIAAAKRNNYSGIRTSEYGADFAAFDAYNIYWNYNLPSLPMFGSAANYVDISVIPHYYDWEWLY